MVSTPTIRIFVLFTFRICFSTSWIFPEPDTKLVSDKGETWLYYNGENLTLHCYMKRLCNVSFTYLNDIPVSSKFVTVVNDTYARLDKPIQEDDPYKAVYHCSNICSGGPQPSMPITVLTESRPRNVTNLRYRWLGRNSLDVQWDLDLPNGYKCSIDKCANKPSTEIAVLYTTCTDFNNCTGKWKNCTRLTSISCTIENFLVPWFSLSVNVSNTVRQDVAPSQFLNISLIDHEEPLPVEILFLWAVNSTCAQLGWSSSVPEAKNYTVKYGNNDPTDSKKMVTEERNVTVCNLRPSLEYNFEVRAVHGYESAPANKPFVMPEDAPSRGPGVTKSSFHRGDCSRNLSQVYVYFEPVDKEDMNGVIVNYTMEVVNEVDEVRGPLGVLPTSTSFYLSMRCDKDVSFRLRAYTKVGPSPPSQLEIPALSTVKDLLDTLKKMDLKVEINSSLSHRQALWEPPSVEDDTTFYLYYCKTDSSCKNVQLNASTGFYTLEGSGATLYGLAAVSPEGKGTGVIFTECVYDTSSPGTVPDNLEARADGQGIRVSWNARRCVSTATQRFMRTGYVLVACYEGNNCKNYTVEGGDVSAYDIVDVKFGTNYSVKIASITTTGVTPYSDPVFVTPSRLESGGSTPGVEVGIAIGVLAVAIFLACIVVCLCREICRKKKQSFSVPIKFPEPPKHQENKWDINNSSQTLVSSSPTSAKEERNMAFTDDLSIKKCDEVQRAESGYHSVPTTPTEENKSDQREHKSTPTIPTQEHSLDTVGHVPEDYVSCVEVPVVHSEQITVGFIQGGMQIKPEDSINTKHTSSNPAYVDISRMFGDPTSIIPADAKVRFTSDPFADRSLVSAAQTRPESYMLVADNGPTFSSVSSEESIAKEIIEEQNTKPCIQSGYLPHSVVTAGHDAERMPPPQMEEFMEMEQGGLLLDNLVFFNSDSLSPVSAGVAEPSSQSVASEEAKLLTLDSQGQQRNHSFGSFCQEECSDNTSENIAKKDDGFVEVTSPDVGAAALTACNSLFQSADGSASKGPNNNYVLGKEARQINQPGAKAIGNLIGSNAACSGELLETVQTNPAVCTNMGESSSDDGEKVGQEEGESYDELFIPEMREANRGYTPLQSVLTGSNAACSGELLETVQANAAACTNMGESSSDDGEKVGQEEGDSYDELFIPERREANRGYTPLQSVPQLSLKHIQEETLASKVDSPITAAGYVQTVP